MEGPQCEPNELERYRIGILGMFRSLVLRTVFKVPFHQVGREYMIPLAQATSLLRLLATDR